MKVFKSISFVLLIILLQMNLTSCSEDDGSDIPLEGALWDILEYTDDGDYKEYTSYYFSGSIVYLGNDFTGYIINEAQDSIPIQFNRNGGLTIYIKDARYYVKGEKISNIGNLVTYEYRWNNEPRLVTHIMKWLKKN